MSPCKAVYQLPVPPGGGHVFIAPDEASLAEAVTELDLTTGAYPVLTEEDLIMPPPATEEGPP